MEPSAGASNHVVQRLGRRREMGALASNEPIGRGTTGSTNGIVEALVADLVAITAAPYASAT
jgi:hypothetical protein